jgi:hypothetical protein
MDTKEESTPPIPIIEKELPIEECEYCIDGKFIRTKHIDRCALCVFKRNHPK